MGSEQGDIDYDAGGDPAASEAIVQAAVLRALLIEHPTHLTIDELTAELMRGDGSSVPIEDAVRRLAEVGLVNRVDQVVMPSRAALYFDGLDID